MPTPEENQKELIRQVVREELEVLNVAEKLIFQKNIQILDARNIQLGRTTGTQIGTATDQKVGFFGTTPVVQQSATDEAEIIVALKALGLIS